MILINAHKLGKSFANKTLFRQVGFNIEDKERVGLIGPNGAGKSTLLKILAGLMEADSGQVTRKRGLRLGYLEQTPTFKGDETILACILSKCLHPDDSFAKAYELMGLLDLFHFGEDFLVSKLSGGWQKRVALARELILEPELLLLDEPTNHLDVTSILWLEDYLKAAPFAVLMITHDRLFLQRVATRILDLDPRNPHEMLSVNGDYAQFLEAKEHELHALSRQETVLKNTLRRETEWLRRGAKARLTKQKARIDATHELADTVSELQNKNRHQKVNLDFGELEKSPKKLIEAKAIAKTYDGKTLFKDLDLLITPKTRLALLGHNGSGKSTLIRVILGLEKPESGSVRIGSTASAVASDIRISYFEQTRETLDMQASVLKNICPAGDFVSYRGQQLHVRSYLDRFLFNGVKVDLPVFKLSGGEQARLRIAQIMLKEAQILVLDEPTNDLDSDTLDILQNALTDFNGAVILVTHDRYFMDAVANQILAFPPEDFTDRSLQKFASYLQWEEWFANEKNRPAAAVKQTAKVAETPSQKLSFNEKFELDNMEASILALENELKELTKKSELPEMLTNASELVKLTKQMNRLQSEIEKKYSRWSELAQKA
jgi:ABC transport system ATP-binding/permease protein